MAADGLGGAVERAGGAPSVPIDEGRGHAVLLIHGQPGSGAEWRPLADLLTGDHHVLAPDRPGWGAHPRPATTLSGNAEAIARMLRGNAPGEQVIAVGHSLGGGIALELALGHPDLVAALVLVSSVGVSSAVSGMDRLLAVPVVGTGMLRAGAAALRRGVRAASRISASPRAEPIFNRAYRYASVRSVMAEGEREMGGRDRRSFLVEQRALLDETPSIERRLSSLRVPCAVVHGSADHVVPLTAGRELAAAIPGAELRVRQGAGHRLAFEEPEIVATVVRRYGRLAFGATEPPDDSDGRATSPDGAAPTA